MCAKVKIPFEYSGIKGFHDKLIEWIGDVLYDILPNQGYEVRDEQIFTAFQIADAFCEQKVHLAEAGLGTGKTFAYLLSAILYARYTGKPVVISCASAALQEQLAAEGSDTYKLSKLLGLDVDARMAKDPRQYICDIRVNAMLQAGDEDAEAVNQWYEKTRLGERSEIPDVPDKVWHKMSWNESMSCELCVNRGYCKLVRAREHYRAAKDLIIADHETFFRDLWTREEKIASGYLPILPNYSAVVFDEGHKIMLPAAMQAGKQLHQEEIEAMLTALETIQGVRDEVHLAIASVEKASDAFFKLLEAAIDEKQSEKRLKVQVNPFILKAAHAVRAGFEQLLSEIQIEQELYLESMPISLVQAYEGQMERVIEGLNQLVSNKGKDVITWIEQEDGSFCIVPKDLTHRLNKALYEKKLPVIFSSATLSNQGDFDYFVRMLGLKHPSKSTIGSPFNMKEQVSIFFTADQNVDAPEQEMQRMAQLCALLKANGGRALILTQTLNAVQAIRQGLQAEALPFNVLYEDEGDRGYLIRKFKADETSVLVSSDFWEGIDVPGDALTLVVIWQLPFPMLDPLIEAQREEARKQGLDPVLTVDYPEMGLRLKQGCGRLIRKETDKGKIVFMDEVIGKPWESVVRGALPKDAEIKS